MVDKVGRRWTKGSVGGLRNGKIKETNRRKRKIREHIWQAI